MASGATSSTVLSTGSSPNPNDASPSTTTPSSFPSRTPTYISEFINSSHTVAVYGFTTLSVLTAPESLRGSQTTEVETVYLITQSTTGIPGSSSTSTFDTTTTSQPTSSTASAQPNQSSTGVAAKDTGSGLSTGAVAGVAIGVAFGVAILTFLATYCIMGSRSRRSRRKHREDGEKGSSFLPMGNTRNPKGAFGSKQPMMTENAVAAPVSRNLDNYFPPSADDGSIKRKVETVLDQISDHVGNYYVKSPLPVPKEAEAELEAFRPSSLPGPLRSLLLQSRDPLPIIKQCLTLHILAHTSPSGNSDATFLPPEFVALPHILANLKSGKSKPVAYDEALSRWRVLTSYLHPTPASSDPSYVKLRDRRISEFVQAFSQAFKAWADTQYPDNERAHSLTEIIKSAAEQGIWLFSQPSTFEFFWGNPDEIGEGKIVVSPALYKVADERAQRLDSPQLMFKMTTKKIGA